MVRAPDSFAAFTAELRRDTESVLAGYQDPPPIVDANGSLSSDCAPGLGAERLALIGVLPLKQVRVET